ncbi:hypothetical protein [Niastella yeongjuensis]|uniref:hypothetical protein n=1 Tax=Niastella yeongjuensis TaxID=354355 RepID=UPI0015A4F02E|nr:hypothetical protein [Niastella yeongjuensis]
MITRKPWLGRRDATLYFYIIKDGNTVKEEKRKVKLPRSEALHPIKLILRFFHMASNR